MGTHIPEITNFICLIIVLFMVAVDLFRFDLYVVFVGIDTLLYTFILQYTFLNKNDLLSDVAVV